MKKPNIVQCTNMGMVRDKDITTISPDSQEFAYENHNIRITAENDNTLLAVTNEKGTQKMSFVNELDSSKTLENFLGTLVGSCKINDYLILFTHFESSIKAVDTIIRLNLKQNSYLALFAGDLHFDINHPLETLPYYESEEIQKVYWVDGLNPNRCINIATAEQYSIDSDQFDFQGKINNIPTVSITKDYTKLGKFSSGTIQYFITYFNKYGKETCIAWQSSLLYKSMSDRGGKEDELISCGFDINISNVDTSYDYIRIYSAEKDSLNGNIKVNIVAELNIDKENTSASYTYTDLGFNKISFNPSDLFFIGGQDLRASTIDQKDDTLFLGNVTSHSGQIPDSILDGITADITERIEEGITYQSCNNITFEHKLIQTEMPKGVYKYDQQIIKSQADIAGFKYREFYRFAVQFQTKTGEWTTPVWIGDSYCDVAPMKGSDGYYIAKATYEPIEAIKQSEFLAYRLLVAEIPAEQRRILAQGVVNPTMFNYAERLDNLPYAMNSWMFRPKNSGITHTHLDTLPIQTDDYAELQGVIAKKIPGIKDSGKSEQPNSYALYFLPDAGHKINYKLVLYNNKGHINSLSDDELVVARLTEDGEQVEVANQKYSDIYAIIDGAINVQGTSKDTWQEAIVELLTDIENKLGSINMQMFLTESMLPSAEQFRFMATAISKNTVDPKLGIECFLGALATAAGIVISILTYGTGTPGVIGGLSAMWSAILASSMAVVAVGGTATMAHASEQIVKAKLQDQDLALIRKGITYINDIYSHKVSARYAYKEKTEENINSLFDTEALPTYYVDVDKHIHESDVSSLSNKFWKVNSDIAQGNECNVYVNYGYITRETDFELSKNTRTNAYYIDESIATLNSPDLENINNNINSQAVKLRLIGTIPVTKSYGDYSIYTSTPGVLDSAKVLHRIFQSDTNPKGLLNVEGYQDTDIDLQYKETLEEGQTHWPTFISPQPNTILYRIFMWNRATSASCYINNGMPIADPLSVHTSETDTQDYLSYIPATIRKKVFANVRFSDTTNFEDQVYNITQDNIKIVRPDTFNLITLTLKNTEKYYYGNVDSIATIPLNEGYTLIKENGIPIWNNTNSEGVPVEQKLVVTDPIEIKFNSNPHLVFNLGSKNNSKVILPYIQNEDRFNINTEYPDLTEDYKFEDITISKSHLWGGMNERVETVDGTLFAFYRTKLGTQETSDIDLNTLLTGLFPWYNSYNNWFQQRTPQYNTLRSSMIASLKKSIRQIKYFYVVKTLIQSDTNPDQNKLFKYDFYIPKVKVDNISHQLVDFNKWIQVTCYTEDELTGVPRGDRGIELSMFGREVIITGIALPEGVDTLEVYNSFDDVKISDNTAIVYLNMVDALLKNKDVQDSLITTVGVNFTVTGIHQDKLNWGETNPYLFLGEVYNENFSLPHDEHTIKSLKWNICSQATDTNGKINTTWGDTFYQRWDCQKTYPATEEDPNGVVDILSFMVESHINLDGRSDVNRGLANILNARPTNFDIINRVYSQPDNTFQYSIIDKDVLNKNSFENQVVWSLTKTSSDLTDKWMEISGNNYLNLNGALGPINKIINYNDNLIAFQDRGISVIQYNEQAALSTESGIPVQLGNTNKVTGYLTVKDNIGCHNKWSIQKTKSGLFFIDDFNKSVNLYNQEGINNIGITSNFSQWFKDAGNLAQTSWTPNVQNKAFKALYDNITNDVYLSNPDTCLVYNLNLQRFTSFMDYQNCYDLANNVGDSILLHQSENVIHLHKMFANTEYNYLLDKYQPYWITYRLNPSPYTDNLFTNFRYVADEFEGNPKLDSIKPLDNTTAHSTFDTVEAWNEYQHGINDLTVIKHRHRHSKDRNRFWDGDIPRDGDTLTSHINASDRMRNPWLFLKLNKNENVTNKMVFHNLTVTYYK